MNMMLTTSARQASETGAMFWLQLDKESPEQHVLYGEQQNPDEERDEAARRRLEEEEKEEEKEEQKHQEPESEAQN